MSPAPTAVAQSQARCGMRRVTTTSYPTLCLSSALKRVASETAPVGTPVVRPPRGCLVNVHAFGACLTCTWYTLPSAHTHRPLLAHSTSRRSVGGGVAALSFDEEFQRRRINRRREAGGGGVDRRHSDSGAHGAARMMVHAVRDLGGGIYHGVTGVVMEPYRRARVSGRASCDFAA